jgi:chromosomal replication initiator protein
MLFSEKTLQCWSNFINILKMELDHDEIEAWVDKLVMIKFDHDSFIISGINQFFCNWISERYYQLLHDKIAKSFTSLDIDPDFHLIIQVGKGLSTNTTDEKEGRVVRNFEDGLNENFSFRSFINGGNSDIAYAAALAVANNIKQNKYNPLFICGDVGLGKTHLVQAIGLRARENDPAITIQYASSKEFTDEVINAIRFGKIQDIRNKYRYVDILIIDDIQFLEDKERTQEEFFHTFNELIRRNRQVILTADRYPREIQKLEERLVNRFNSGMVAKIYPPDFETRVAIIRAKIEKMKIPLSSEIIDYIAGAVKTNVRDIEGILIHIEANWSLLGQKISLDMTKKVLKDTLDLESNPKTIEYIIKTVGDKFDIKVTDIKSERRDKEISKTRQIAMYVVREVTGSSYPVIGKHFGGKNHTTVLQACKKTKEWMDRDPEIKQSVTIILREISG